MRLVALLLERAGYRVVTAASAREARAVARALEGRIDLLLTDVVMPEESGVALARDLLRERPDLLVVFMSGHTEDEALRRGLRDEHAFLPKPFDQDALLACIRAAFRRARAA